MPKYVGKPIEIEARQLIKFTGDGSDNTEELAEWCGGEMNWNYAAWNEGPLNIVTLPPIGYISGNGQTVKPGDWIIHDVEASVEWYVMKDKDFQANYELK